MAAYSELIKNFDKIREYVRDFYIFGFHTRENFDSKSRRTYDNEKRRIESWLKDYVQTSLEGHRKKVSVNVDSSHIFQNPLYQCFRSKTFTDNDIRLHFILMELLDGKSMTVSETADSILRDYGLITDVQIIRLKLKEYAAEGLVNESRSGKNVYYTKSDCYADDIAGKFPEIKDIVMMFSGENPLGVIGSFIMDRLDLRNSLYTRKHAYMVHTLDDEILLNIMGAMEKRKSVLLSCVSRKKGNKHEITAVPLKVHCSVQTGRNYIVIYDIKRKRLLSVRIDSVVSAKILSDIPDYDKYCRYYNENLGYLWGTSFGNDRKYGQTEHIHMEIVIDEKTELFVLKRLQREKRNGTVTKIAEGRYAFDIDVFDANEASPWIKTFIGRISVFESTNQELQERFYLDIERLSVIYGGDVK